MNGTGVEICPGMDTLLTGDDLLEMEGDYELVRGELVPVTPPGGEHGAVQVNAVVVLAVYARQVGGRVLTESGIYTAEGPDTVRGPDVLYFGPGRLSELPKAYFRQAPELVVEIISPDDRSAEIETKVAEYLARGVRRVWLLYPGTRTLYVHGLGAQVLKLQTGAAVTDPEVLPGFTCQVADFFL